MSVEDRVRAAARARAALVRDVRPLDLPAIPDRPPRARRWVTWSAPVAAAAAVAALAVSLATVRHTPNAPAAPAALPAVSGMLPEYYAALNDPRQFISETPPQHKSPVSLSIGDDRTGKVVATVKPPDGQTFVGLTAAADDRTFVVAAERFPALNSGSWYLVRLTPGSAVIVALARLPIPSEPAGTQVSAIALAPDGSELAVMSQQNVEPGKTGVESGQAGPLTIRLYSLATGTPVRTWTADTKGFPAGVGWYSNTALTWTDGGHSLAVLYGINTTRLSGMSLYDFSDLTIRTVDAGSPSGDLLASSMVVFRVPDGGNCDTVQLTGDGKTVLCGKDSGTTTKPGTGHAAMFVAYSVATGRPRLLYQLPGSYVFGLAEVLWASPTGSTVLGAIWANATWTVAPEVTDGLLTNGRFTRVKFPLTTVPFAGDIAF